MEKIKSNNNNNNQSKKRKAKGRKRNNIIRSEKADERRVNNLFNKFISKNIIDHPNANAISRNTSTRPEKLRNATLAEKYRIHRMSEFLFGALHPKQAVEQGLDVKFPSDLPIPTTCIRASAAVPITTGANGNVFINYAPGGLLTMNYANGEQSTLTVNTTCTPTGTAGTNSFTYALVSDPGTYSSGGSVSGDVYNNINVTWYGAGQTQTGFQTPATAFFSVIIDADVSGTQNPNPTAEQIYAYIQAQLRKTTNINAGSISESTGDKIGKVVPEKLRFIGDDLYTLGQSSLYEGVYIADYNDADVNRLHFWGYGSAAVADATISSISRATNVVTVNTSAAHGFSNNDYIVLS